MTQLLQAEFSRLLARRITRYFPLTLGALILFGIGLAIVVTNQAEDFDSSFVDVAGGTDAGGLLDPIAVPLLIMGFVLGASSIGADAKTGMLQLLLTWEPRRLRFLAARSTAVSTVSAILSVLLSALLILAELGWLSSLQTVGDTSGGFWGNVALTVVRTAVVTALAAILGVSVTLLTGSSMGSIVGYVLYLMILDGVLVQLFLPRVWVYLPISNALAFASGSDVEIIHGALTEFPTFSSHHGYRSAGLIFAAWCLGALAIAAVRFQRADIAD